MARVNLAKRYEELQRIQQAFRDARKLVERDLGRKVLELYLAGADVKEIYREIRHIVDEVYGYRKFLELRKPAQATQEKKTRKEVKKNENRTEPTTTTSDSELYDSLSSGTSGTNESAGF